MASALVTVAMTTLAPPKSKEPLPML
jgi:hypothetical protein